MDHLREQSGIDLIAGALVEPHAAEVHAHLDRCAECRGLVGVMLRVEATPPQLGTPREAPDPSFVTIAEAPAARRGSASPRWPMSPSSPIAPPPLEHIDEYRVLDL